MAKSDGGVAPAGGVSIKLVRGAEKYAPVQYHSFDVGPFEIGIYVAEGEVIAPAVEAGRLQLKAMRDACFEEQLATFLAGAKTARTTAGGGR